MVFSPCNCWKVDWKTSRTPLHRGINRFQSSYFSCHGNLKSSNCAWSVAVFWKWHIKPRVEPKNIWKVKNNKWKHENKMLDQSFSFLVLIYQFFFFHLGWISHIKKQNITAGLRILLNLAEMHAGRMKGFILSVINRLPVELPQPVNLD